MERNGFKSLVSHADSIDNAEPSSVGTFSFGVGESVNPFVKLNMAIELEKKTAAEKIRLEALAEVKRQELLQINQKRSEKMLGKGLVLQSSLKEKERTHEDLAQETINRYKIRIASEAQERRNVEEQQYQLKEQERQRQGHLKDQQRAKELQQQFDLQKIADARKLSAMVRAMNYKESEKVAENRTRILMEARELQRVMTEARKDGTLPAFFNPSLTFICNNIEAVRRMLYVPQKPVTPPIVRKQLVSEKYRNKRGNSFSFVAPRRDTCGAVSVLTRKSESKTDPEPTNEAAVPTTSQAPPPSSRGKEVMSERHRAMILDITPVAKSYNQASVIELRGMSLVNSLNAHYTTSSTTDKSWLDAQLHHTPSSLEEVMGDDALQFESADSIVAPGGTVRGVKGKVRKTLKNLFGPESNTKFETPLQERLYGQETGKIVVYITSVQVNRSVFEQCKSVLRIFEMLRLKICVKDIQMDSRFIAEMEERMPGSMVPQIFVSFLHIGGADRIQELNETGQLAAMFPGFEQRSATTCGICAGYGYIACSWCQGSKKSLVHNFGLGVWQQEGSLGGSGMGSLKCTVCNENGLQRCESC